MRRILLVDDHAIIRQGIRQILADAQEHFEISEASNGPDAIATLRKGDWDMVLLDIGLPGKGGIDILKQIKSEWKRLPVLMLSSFSEEQYAVRAIRAGASGYMTKDSAPDQLVSAIRKVASGGRYISAEVAEKLAFEVSEDSDGRLPHNALSDREFEVLKAIASGKSVTDISNELHLSVKTVSTYRSRILEKMDMRHNAELTHYAIKHGLVE